MSSALTFNQTNTIINNAVHSTAGSINEGGIINDLKRRGFTLFNCLCEIIANSIDAKCTKFRFIITPDYIKIIDNGSGMTFKKLKDMFDMLKSNHLNDKSMGISGLGGKAATLTLSKEQNVTIYTFDGEKYLTADVPWDDIVEQQKYIDMIKISLMNDESIEEFKNDREGHGTTIILPYDTEVHEEIVKNFNTDRLKLRINERFDVIFGNFPNVEISLTDNTDPTNNIILQHYDFFSKPDHSYYKGIFKYLIHVFCICEKSKIYRFIWEKNEEEYFEIIPCGRGLSKKSSRVSYPNLEPVATFTFTNALMKNNKIFNEENPGHLCKTTMGQDLGEYDNNYFITKDNYDIVKEDLSKCSIIRNNQVINYLSFDKFKHSSARGNVEALLKTIFLRSKLSYQTFSSCNNHLDFIMGIQSNKNQLNPKDIPVSLIRLLEDIKTDCWDTINKYFKDVTAAAAEAAAAEAAAAVAEAVAEAVAAAAAAEEEAASAAAEAASAAAEAVAATAEEEEVEDKEVNEEVNEEVEDEEVNEEVEDEEVAAEDDTDEENTESIHLGNHGHIARNIIENLNEDDGNLNTYIETITKLELIQTIKTTFDEAKDRFVANINHCEGDIYSKSILDKLTDYLNKISVM